MLVHLADGDTDWKMVLTPHYAHAMATLLFIMNAPNLCSILSLKEDIKKRLSVLCLVDAREFVDWWWQLHCPESFEKVLAFMRSPIAALLRKEFVLVIRENIKRDKEKRMQKDNKTAMALVFVVWVCVAAVSHPFLYNQTVGSTEW